MALATAGVLVASGALATSPAWAFRGGFGGHGGFGGFHRHGFHGHGFYGGGFAPGFALGLGLGLAAPYAYGYAPYGYSYASLRVRSIRLRRPIQHDARVGFARSPRGAACIGNWPTCACVYGRLRELWYNLTGRPLPGTCAGRGSRCLAYGRQSPSCELRR